MLPPAVVARPPSRVASRSRSVGRASLLALLGLVASACPNFELAALEPCTRSGVNIDAAQDGIDEVDILFMIDNSSSMAEEQVKLSAKLAKLVAVLTSGDREAGNPSAAEYENRRFNPARSLHLGIVSSDLGRPPSAPELPGCGANNGSNGVLQHDTQKAASGIFEPARGSGEAPRLLVPGDPACAVSVPAYIDFGVDGAYHDAALAAQHFQCAAKLGVDGCGIEQQLASAAKALMPSIDQSFVGPDKAGQGDRANRGFLRTNSVLALVMVTDEDDCSVSDTAAGAEMFSGAASTLGTKCQVTYRDNPQSEALLSVRALAERFLALRANAPERFVFAGIVGLPTQASGVNYDDRAALLARSDMAVTVVDGKNEVAPVCFEDEDPSSPRPEGIARGDAKPGRRFVELANEIASRNGGVVLRSICDRDYDDALDQVIEKIAKQLKGACLPRPLRLDATGQVACDVVEILPFDTTDTCDAAGRELAGKRSLEGEPEGEMRHLGCTLTQLPFDGRSVPSAAGWYYDAVSDETRELCGTPEARAGEIGQRIVVTEVLPLRRGAVARVECFQKEPRVVPDTFGFAALNTPCVDGTGCTSKTGAQLSLPEEPLLCEPISHSCQIPCATSAECPEGWLCAGSPSFCQSPTCSDGS